ncbi:sensor histidine kinase [Nonomuraea sp. SBT364]|uniref:sensor histidine kinase n=1 Tax=Nonomuraea sp. SBT364 TaxID=1580530 RepID=UPI00069FA43C|nr:sensor histidine kinase [Nonomuraea sp. SBT364]
MRGWTEFDGDRAPVVLEISFWGAALISAFVYVASLHPDVRPGLAERPLIWAFFWMGAAALLAACVLWFLLPWRASAPAGRKALTVLFLGVSLFMMSAGSITALLISCLAVGNALVVFGVRGAVAYSIVTGSLHFGTTLLNPAHTLFVAVVNGLLALFLCVVIVLVMMALLEAHRQAVRTRHLLAELEEAHAALRRYAEQSRDLAVADERARMARDMHDSIGHHLTVINMGLANAQRFRTARPESAWEEVRQAQELTRDALNDTRRWVRALKPLRMEGRTGSAALELLAASFRSADLEVVFAMDGDWPDVAEGHELVCYRVLQEGLTNVLRHARAGRVDVTLGCASGEVTLTIADDGAGADPDRVAEGFGLRGLEERLRAIGGALEIDNRPGDGFALTAKVRA